MKVSRYVILLIVLVVIVIGLITSRFFESKNHRPGLDSSGVSGGVQTWIPPDTLNIPNTPEGDLIHYGRNLIVHTALYLGSKGSVSHSTNGMNCQNCHFDAGTRLLGNNFSEVAANYPEFRKRSDGMVTIAQRVNGCMERSLNGTPIDTTGKEMKAFIAYFEWLGKAVKKGMKTYGSGIENPPFLNRAADPSKGKIIYVNMCQACHGKDGEGLWNGDSTEYRYPPLWGPNSYNSGAGLYRLSEFSGFAKNNMPFGTTYHKPVLTNEQSWDIAAFVNSQPRPAFKGMKQDWPDLKYKPFDDPFGPYIDTFSEQQHKFGPYTNMVQEK